MGWVQLQDNYHIPISLPSRNYNKNGRDFFCDAFPKGRREKKNFQNFQGFFPEFFHSFLSIFFFSIFFFLFFIKKNEGYIQESQERGRLCVVYHGTLHMVHYTQPPTFATSSSYFVLFLVSSPNFVQLFGGLSKLCFFRTLYFWKDLNVQFGPNIKIFGVMVIKIRVRKEDYAMLKIL